MSIPPHIFTLTGNLLAERTLEFTDWSTGRTQRAIRDSFLVGGKGINDSKMLNRLSVPITALCFAGGATGEDCQLWLAEHGFRYRAFRTHRPTRTGTVIRSPHQPETTFLATDVSPSAGAIQNCAEFLDLQIDGQILALCGSFPGWDDAAFDPLRAAIERWARRGKLVADTYGPPLDWLARHPLALVKVNAGELSTLLGGPDPASAALTSPPAAFCGVQRWVITDGPNAVWLRDGTTAPESIVPPRVEEVSPTGSGDVLLAAVLTGLFIEEAPLRDAVQRALPLAAANAAHPGIAEFV
jgi:fructose-1-phosphate kinase PfkB-like protein